MERLTREMTFEEEYIILQKEAKELFEKEDRESEPPESHCVVRRALRCIKKLFAELEPYKEYKDLEEQGLLLRLPVPIGTTVYKFEPLAKGTERYIKTTITRYEVFNDSIWFTFANGLGRNIEDFGKYVFLTQEEAEQKLKEMESESE